MRPAILFPLFATARTLSGVGPKIEKLLAKVTGAEPPRVVDLLFHLPAGLIDRSYRPKLIAAEAGRIARHTALRGSGLLHSNTTLTRMGTAMIRIPMATAGGP